MKKDEDIVEQDIQEPPNDAEVSPNAAEVSVEATATTEELAMYEDIDLGSTAEATEIVDIARNDDTSEELPAAKKQRKDDKADDV